MEKTSKQDHKERAIATIAAFIADDANTVSWKADDLKTRWLSRAIQVGVTGYSAHLKDMYIKSTKNVSRTENVL